MLNKAELQRLRSLRDRKHRADLGLFVVEGEKVVAELLAAGLLSAATLSPALPRRLFREDLHRAALQPNPHYHAAHTK